MDASQHRAELYRELFGDSDGDSSDSEASVPTSTSDSTLDADTGPRDPKAKLVRYLAQTSAQAVLAQTSALSQQRADAAAIEEPVPGFVVHRNALNQELCTLFFDWLSSEYFPNTPPLCAHAAEKQEQQEQQPRINQGMHFGALTDTATPFGFLSGVCALHPHLLPTDLRARSMLFDQAIINLYDPGEGIGDHIDLLRFADGIVGFSFGSPATLRLRPVDSADIERASHYAVEQQETGDPRQVLLVISPGDVYAMSGEARYRWTHGFPKSPPEASHSQDGANAGRRISVTLRKLV
ncbi:hypothetical protein GQ54DRAFT_79690 [Martensiomyces pterosporus]|nr:hypothetical protein GQ54DRAFT_79690 [Martensiomyces pterosporus]